MELIPTKEHLPSCVTKEVWWWDSYNSCWLLRTPLHMNFSDKDTFAQYTHWLPEEAIVFPY